MADEHLQSLFKNVIIKCVSKKNLFIRSLQWQLKTCANNCSFLVFARFIFNWSGWCGEYFLEFLPRTFSTEIRHSHGWIFHKQHLQHLSNFLLDDFCGSWKKGSLAAPRTCPLGNCDPKKIVGYLDSCMHIRFCIWFGSCGRLYKFCPPTVVRPLPHFVAVSQNFRKTSNG